MFAPKMKTKRVSTSGVHAYMNLLPTFGTTIESRMNTTMNSRPFMKPEGTSRSCFRYRRVVSVTPKKTMVETNNTMKTCFVIEKSIPNRRGR